MNLTIRGQFEINTNGEPVLSVRQPNGDLTLLIGRGTRLEGANAVTFPLQITVPRRNTVSRASGSKGIGWDSLLLSSMMGILTIVECVQIYSQWK